MILRGSAEPVPARVEVVVASVTQLRGGNYSDAGGAVGVVPIRSILWAVNPALRAGQDQVLNVTPEDLRLDEVERLLQQAGWPVPDRAVLGDAAFLQSLIDALCELSLRDPLTGIANRRAFLSILRQEVDRVARSGEPALLLAVDIDHFKRINDTHGHGAGDEVIRAVARSLQACVRPMDTVARMGGEEFAVVLPNCGPTYGAVVTERIRAAVEALAISHYGVSLQVTVSCGGAFAPAWVRSSLELWLERADEQLYRAKHGGRNQVCLEPTTSSVVSAEEKGLLFSWGQTDGLMIDAPAPH